VADMNRAALRALVGMKIANFDIWVISPQHRNSGAGRFMREVSGLSGNATLLGRALCLFAEKSFHFFTV
jgi:hypothetical protein